MYKSVGRKQQINTMNNAGFRLSSLYCFQSQTDLKITLSVASSFAMQVSSFGKDFSATSISSYALLLEGLFSANWLNLKVNSLEWLERNVDT